MSTGTYYNSTKFENDFSKSMQKNFRKKCYIRPMPFHDTTYVICYSLSFHGGFCPMLGESAMKRERTKNNMKLHRPGYIVPFIFTENALIKD